MLMGRFDDKVVMITGAARGQGRSHAIAFAREGANLVISDIARELKDAPYPMGTMEELEETAEMAGEFGQKVVSVECDVTSESQVKAMVEAGTATFGKVDVLINNAGLTKLGLIHETSEDDVFQTINIMLIGPIRVCRYVVPQMIKQKDGCIINISSSAVRGMANIFHYVAAKSGIEGLTKALAIDLAPHNIRVNCIRPGAVDTPLVAGLSSQVGMTPDEVLRFFCQQTYLLDDVVIKSENVSNACLYLASDPVLTGVFLSVDAGASLSGKA